MRIWLIATGEPWPTDGEAPRFLRAGINANYLSGRDHQVVWWNGTFNQRLGIERPYRDGSIDAVGGYRVVGLYGGGYTRNVSVRRIMHNRAMAKAFCELAPGYAKPDVIVTSLTPVEVACAAVEHGKKIGCPVIVDVRDLWPDIWLELVPSWTRHAARLALWTFYRDLRRTISRATAITGITEPIVDWALASGRRKRTSIDRAFPLVYPAQRHDSDKLVQAARWWHERGVGADGAMLGCYFGALTIRADFETPIRALRQMSEEERSRIKLVLCGRGEAESAIRELAAGMKEVIVPGWIDAVQIQALMQACSFGLLPYRPTPDYVRSLPNKVFEYMSGGLPIVTSLRGVIEQFFSEHSCGILYNMNDPQSFREAVIRLASSPDLMSHLKTAASNAATKFDANTICAEFESYLEEIAARGPAELTRSVWDVGPRVIS